MIEICVLLSGDPHDWTVEMMRHQEAGYPVESEPAPECWGA